MNTRRLRPPSGGDDAPQTSAPVRNSEAIDLLAFATTVCQQYRSEFPDERDRYGDAGIAWCVHDNQHLLNWAVEAVNGDFDIKHEVAWLANILEARQFPVDRLARNLDICAEVTSGALPADPGNQLGEVLTSTAVFVRTGAFRGYSD